TAEVLLAAVHHDEPQSFLADALTRIAHGLSADYAAVASMEGGTWKTTAHFGAPRELPSALLANVLDAERLQRQATWIAAPLQLRGGGELLLANLPSMVSGSSAESILEALAPLLGDALAAVRARQAERNRARRLEAILDISSQWYLIHE